VQVLRPKNIVNTSCCAFSACCPLFPQAVKLLAQLASRLPNLVQLLQPNFDDSEALLLRQGCAQSLELALLDPSAGQSVSSGMAAAAARTGEQETAGAGEDNLVLLLSFSVCC
jgi:hypothetical protein